MLFSRPKTYTVYVKNDVANPLETAEFIPENFSIFAFIFQAFWALYHRIWWAFGFLFAVSIGFSIIEMQGLLNQASVMVLQLGFGIWIGFEANGWRQNALTEKGYSLFSIIVASSELEAQQRFFAQYGPQMPASYLPSAAS